MSILNPRKDLIFNLFTLWEKEAETATLRSLSYEVWATEVLWFHGNNADMTNVFWWLYFLLFELQMHKLKILTHLQWRNHFVISCHKNNFQDMGSLCTAIALLGIYHTKILVHIGEDIGTCMFTVNYWNMFTVENWKKVPSEGFHLLSAEKKKKK